MSTNNTLSKSFKRGAVALLVAAFLFSSPVFAKDISALRGDQLQTSITSFENREMGGIHTISKTWNETYDARQRFDISMFSYSPDLKKPRSIFLQAIKIFNGDKEIQVHDWDSADCSLEKIMIINKDGSPYLGVADRAENDSATEIIPQNTPAPQMLMLFKLYDIGLVSSHNEAGKSQFFFQKIAEQKSTKAFCSADAIYSAIAFFADKTLK